MLVFPGCKINIGLRVVSRRDDGYHNLETVFYPVPVYDALEALPNRRSPNDEWTQTGLPIAGDPANNLCLRALALLRQELPPNTIPALRMHLHKAIPMGAGLGGGSADGAYMLRLLNEQFGLALPRQRLLNLALELGSDCPFFIDPQPCFAWGRGELMEPLPLQLSGYELVLVNPGIHINTGWAFRQIKPEQPATPLAELVQLPVAEWRQQVINDFEAPVAAAYPPVSQILEQLYAQGAVYAAMSGSGSTCYGLFAAGTVPPQAWPERYWYRVLAL
jgi:4-diphosphocytidyl-2-C-methyl-D-erythritol kinase